MIEYHKKNYGSVVVNKFRDYLWEMEQSENTIDSYCISANMFMKYVGITCEKDICHITKMAVCDFVEHLRNDDFADGNKYQTSTINLKIAGMNRFLEFNGLKDLKAKSLHRQRRLFINDNEILNDMELSKLLGETQKYDEDIYYMNRAMVQTGMRVSEIGHVAYESLCEGYVEVYNKGSDRQVQLPPDLKDELLNYCTKKHITSGSVFLSKNGKMVSRTLIAKTMKKLGKRLGIPAKKLHPHNFRHYFALKYIKINGENKISRLADILGHKSIETTRIYLQSTLTDISEKLTLKSLKIKIAS